PPRGAMVHPDRVRGRENRAPRAWGSLELQAWSYKSGSSSEREEAAIGWGAYSWPSSQPGSRPAWASQERATSSSSTTDPRPSLMASQSGWPPPPPPPGAPNPTWGSRETFQMRRDG